MRDSILRTPLHDAVQYGSVRLTRALIEQCSELDVADINGVTPLSLAVRNREVAIVKLLLDAGADVETSRCTCMSLRSMYM